MWADSHEAPFQAGVVRVVSRQGLIALKLAAGREVDRLLAERGFRSKGVDLSDTAVTARLRTLGALSDMCRRLGGLGAQLRPLSGDGRR